MECSIVLKLIICKKKVNMSICDVTGVSRSIDVKVGICWSVGLVALIVGDVGEGGGGVGLVVFVQAAVTAARTFLYGRLASKQNFLKNKYYTMLTEV